MAVVSERTGLVKQRYRDGYRVGKTIVGVGNAIKIIGVIVAVLIAVVFLLAASALKSVLFVPVGLLAAAVIGLAFWLSGVFISCQGQVLLASLDLAVNTSHFLTDDERASVMSLPHVGGTRTEMDTGDQSLPGYVSLAGQSGTAFCLGCRKEAPKTLLWYKKETDAYYHKECIPTTARETESAKSQLLGAIGETIGETIRRFDRSSTRLEGTIQTSTAVIRIDKITGEHLYGVNLRRGIKYQLVGPAGDKNPNAVILFAEGNYFLGPVELAREVS